MSLHDAFADLRFAERRAAPPLRIAQPVMWWRPIAAVAVMLVVVTSIVAVIPREPSMDISITAPTDFLLQTPQADLLQTVPAFGERNVIR